MSRKSARQQVGVALFPFLAVLICTMGALIVLLVLLVQQARVDATTIAATQIGAAPDAGLRERLEDAQWQRELLEKSRAEKSEELTGARARVAHLEEHTQRLEVQAKELLDRARAIDEGKKLRNEDLASARAEAARLKAEIDRKKKELEEAKKKVGDGQEWYALIPYDGRSGTRRRPIYVECTEFGVVVQPEGMMLKAEDFNGPLGPGNPLDSALRAIREHWERTTGTKAGQPYPLLVVRPSGVIAFGAAKAAIRAWDDEWGYELISDDKQLDFGPPDPALSDVLSKTVSVARERQAAMVAMMPRRFQDDEPLKSFAPEPSIRAAGSRYVGGNGTGLGNGTGPGSGTGPGNGTGSSATSTGRGGGYATGGNNTAPGGTGSGTGMGGGPGGLGYGSGGRGGAGQAGGSSMSGGGAGSGNGGQSGGSGLPSAISGGGGSPGFGQSLVAANGSAGGGAGSGGGAAGGAFPGSPLSGSGAGNGGSGGSGYGAGGSGQQGNGFTGGAAGGQSPGASGQGGSGGAAGGGQPGGGQSGGSQQGTQGGNFAGGSSGDTFSTFGGSSSGASGGSSSATGGSSAGGGGSSMMSGGSPGGMGMPSLTFGANKSGSPSSSGGSQGSGSPKSTAKRGNNWALPQAKTHQTGVTRPMRVSLEPDRVVLVPERGDDRPPQVVKIAPDLSLDDVNHVVAAVQSEVKGWGLAVSDGYWKPVLQVQVAPGAEQHYSNLEMALRGSGIDMVRR